MAELSRRFFLRSSALSVGAAFVMAGAGRVGRAVAAAMTTATSSIRRGPAGAGGYRRLIEGPPLPRVLRTDLGALANDDRTTGRTGVCGFVQFSDVHIVDHQSPLRLEWLDRYEDPASLPGLGLFSSSYRPQEMLTAQVAEAMVRATNALTETPVLGMPVGFVIQTGDNSDNSQYNEIRWNIDLLDGETVRPDSGSTAKYQGVMIGKDTHYWHPHGDIPTDQARAEHGFPTIPGLLDKSRKEFAATGLNVPWYSVFGNHDGLVQGNFPLQAVLNLIAIGPLKIMSPPPGFSQADAEKLLTKLDLNAILGPLLGSLTGTKLVTPDPRRRLLSRKKVVAEHFNTSGSPVGHGFTEENRTKGTAYYVLDKGDVRFVVMDTVNANGYADGSLGASQFAWVKKVVEEAAGRLVVMVSHHTSATMGNPLVVAGGELENRVLGGAVVQYLLTQPQVIAWVNGHTHRNEIIPHTSPTGGFWEINTASHIDFPQQARIIEIANNHDGTLSIFTTILDHAAPAEFTGDLDSPMGLASLARELSANDWQVSGTEGEPGDLNVELLITTPSAYAGATAALSSARSVAPTATARPRRQLLQRSTRSSR